MSSDNVTQPETVESAAPMRTRDLDGRSSTVAVTERLVEAL